MNLVRRVRPLALAGAALGLLAGAGEASLSRNAAGARNMGEESILTVDAAGQLERDPDGQAWTIEATVQYEASRRIQLLVEAVPFTRESADGEETASGVGDTEVTMSWLALEETGLLPPVVLAGRMKVPTANRDLGTGKPDYGALLILGKEFGELDVSLETEVATFGSPAGTDLKDQFLYTFTAEYGLTGFLAVYGELSGHSAPSVGEERSDVGLLGLELDVEWGEHAAPYVTVEHDTEDVTTVQGGVEWSW